MGIKIDITGIRFDRLLVNRLLHRGPKHSYWECFCDCGNIITATMNNLRKGNSTSCGCKRIEATSTSGGLYETSEYIAWENMLSRCRNPKNPSYKNYGLRGIRVAEEWNDFLVFYRDMGPKPDPKYTLDRIDNSGPYYKDNCQWATRTQQARNTRKNRIITFQGRSQCLSAWAKELGLSPNGLRKRLRRWPLDKALSNG